VLEDGLERRPGVPVAGRRRVVRAVAAIPSLDLRLPGNPFVKRAVRVGPRGVRRQRRGYRGGAGGPEGGGTRVAEHRERHVGALGRG